MPDSPGGIVSVIVVNWNRKELLRACLESLSKQSGVQIEIIVVDNGSTDGSAEMVENCSLPIKLIRNAENRGFCEANNQGFAAANGEWIALLNNDAEAEPNWLASMVAAVRSDPTIGMIASKILVWEDPTIIDKTGHLIYLDGQNRGRGSGQRDVGQFDRVEEVLWPDGCAAMYKRDMIRQIGGFDEDFFAYGDDAELGLRGRIAGWKCVYAPGAVVKHHRGATLGVLSTARIELIERNRVLLAVKLFPWRILCLNAIFYLARLAAGALAAIANRGEVRRFQGFRAKCNLAMALMRADWAALKLTPKMLRKRSQLRPLRKLNPSEVTSLLLQHRITLKELMYQAI
jgi:GT2 family glycosyltransferase